MWRAGTDPSSRHRARVAAFLPVVAAIALGCPSDDGGSLCADPCDPRFQSCRGGECVNVCPGPCNAPQICNFATGRCDYPEIDAGPDDSGPPCDDLDGDTIADVFEPAGDPDGDTIPSGEDPDSDGDTIADLHEGAPGGTCGLAPADTDGDGTPDFLDSDSDNDGWDDADEAGDGRLDTRPRDTDDWGVPDFRDRDSDNDGLSDPQEFVVGTGRTDGDTDGDTWTDLEEWGYASADPLDAGVHPEDGAPLERLPYLSTAVWRSYTFTIDFKAIDVSILLAGSARADAALRELSAGFASEVEPVLRDVLPGSPVGTAIFGDGETLIAKTGTPVARLLAGTTAPSAWSVSLSHLPSCADGDAALLTGEALAEVADGRSLAGFPSPSACPAGAAGLTCPRLGSVPFVVLVTSGLTSAPGATLPADARSLGDAQSILRSRDGRVVPVLVGPDDAAAAGVQSLALSFGAVGPGGAPIWIRAAAGGTAAAVGDAVELLARSVTQDVEMVAIDEPDDPPAATPDQEVDASRFAYYLDAYRYSPAPGFGREESVSRISGSTFFGAVRGTEVGYRVYYRNGTMAPGPDGRRFRARLVARTTAGAEIWVREMHFVIPAQVGDVTDGR